MSAAPHLEVRIIGTTASHVFAALWLEVQSPTGEFVLAPDHYPLISLLKKDSRLSYLTTENQISSYDISGGIVIIENNVVLILLDESPGLVAKES